MRITNLPLVQEVRNEYLELRKDGIGRADAVLEMQQRYKNELAYGAEDDGLLFWVGLGDAQYSAKELTLDVACKATHALRKITSTDWGVSQGDIDRRLAHYQQAPQPEKKFGKAKAKFRCNWEIGDTFAYKISEISEYEMDQTTYILLRKVSDMEFGDGSLYPVVTLSLWKHHWLPKDADDFSSVPNLRLNRNRYLLPEGLYEYRAELIIPSQRKLAKVPLIYLGCFADVPSPADEGIVNHPAKMTMLLLDCLDRDLSLYIKLSKLYAQEAEERD